MIATITYDELHRMLHRCSLSSISKESRFALTMWELGVTKISISAGRLSGRTDPESLRLRGNSIVCNKFIRVDTGSTAVIEAARIFNYKMAGGGASPDTNYMQLGLSDELTAMRIKLHHDALMENYGSYSKYKRTKKRLPK